MKKPIRREIFVLTPDEKKAVACVLGALFLGLGTKYYRETHPRPPPPLNPRQQYAAQRASKAASARARSARGQRAAAAARPTPAPALEEADDAED